MGEWAGRRGIDQSARGIDQSARGEAARPQRQSPEAVRQWLRRLPQERASSPRDQAGTQSPGDRGERRARWERRPQRPEGGDPPAREKWAAGRAEWIAARADRAAARSDRAAAKRASEGAEGPAWRRGGPKDGQRTGDPRRRPPAGDGRGQRGSDRRRQGDQLSQAGPRGQGGRPGQADRSSFGGPARGDSAPYRPWFASGGPRGDGRPWFADGTGPAGTPPPT